MGSVVASLARGLPGRAVAALSILLATAAANAAPPDLGPGDRETLGRYARDAWRSFEAMARAGELPADGLRMDDDGAWRPTRKTTPTDVAAYLWSALAAERLGIVPADEAGRRLDRALTALARLRRVHGFFLDRLDPETGEPLKAEPEGGAPIKPLVSAVDNGWLAMALMMVAGARPELHDRAEGLLKPMDFGFLYEPYDRADPVAHPGQLHGTYQPDDGSFGAFHGLVNTEPRIASYIGLTRGQLPAEHYYRIGRTGRPGEGPEQQQTPEGVTRTYQGVEVFEGHYAYRGLKVVPSWGGSMFEALMVPLFVPEDRWAPRSWGVNHPLYVRAQIEHGLREAKYGYWGFSPACRPDGGYGVFGVAAVGVDPKGYGSGEKDRKTGAFRGGVVTPHASFLALRFAPREALDNLRKLADAFPVYGPYGFLDSVNVADGTVADCVLALDQGMILAAIANALADDAMRHAFSDGAVESAVRPLIAPEEFTAAPPASK